MNRNINSAGQNRVQDTMSQYDVIIIGSGIVGLTAAVALAKNTQLKVAVLDAQPKIKPWQASQYDHRVSAISLTSKRIFEKINVWEKIFSKRVSPFSSMNVWEEKGSGKIQFAAQEVGEPFLGFIIEDAVMRTSLIEAAGECAQLEIIPSLKLIEIREQNQGVEVIAEGNQNFFGKLVIAADGAHSWVREKCGIDLKTWDYDQTAIVATVKTESTHQQTAWQRFLTTGPLAFLPLQNNLSCSIVWSATHEQAQCLLQLNDEEFCNQLEKAFESQLGSIVEISQRYHFPLRMRHAKNYVRERLALIGDAAHTIHPLAGQGVNLGLLDAACLVEVIMDALKKQRNFSSFSTLRRYERWRKSDNTAMQMMVQAFVSEKKSLKIARTAGLNLTEQVSLLKNFFVNYALGKRNDLPAMALPLEL